MSRRAAVPAASLASAIAAAVLLAGCCARSGGLVVPLEGTTRSRYIVLGFGYVDVVRPTNAPGIVGSAVRGFGAQVSDVPGLRFGAGYFDATTVVAATNTDALVDFSRPAGRARRMEIRAP